MNSEKMESMYGNISNILKGKLASGDLKEDNLKNEASDYMQNQKRYQKLVVVVVKNTIITNILQNIDLVGD